MTTTFIKSTTALSLVLLLSACGLSNKQKFETYTQSYQQANYCEAAGAVLDESDNCNKTVEDMDLEDYNIDEKLNAGTALFLAKKPELSNALFTTASTSIQEEFSSSGIGRGTAEVVANASLVDYDPMIMDSIYLHAYSFMNALSLKDKEEAKIQINRAYAVQQNAVKEFSKEIEKQKQEAEKEASEMDEAVKKGNNENISSVMSNYAEFSKWKGYADFVNPYVTYLSGLYFMLNGTSSSDYETASNYLKRVRGMMYNNPYVQEDLALADKLASGQRNIIEPTAWIVFENGEITNLKDFKIDLPIFLVTRDVKTASLALPYPNERAEAYPSISVSNGKQRAQTSLLTNMDNIFISEFKERLPGIVAKAVTKLTLQTAAQVALRQSTKGTDAALIGEIASFAVGVYSIATTTADTRSWYGLPKNVQLAKIKKNGNNLTLQVGAQTLNVSVPKEGHSLIYVRVPVSGTVPAISVFDL